MNHITARYNEIGLPATLPEEQRRAWEDYLAGRGAFTRLLPKNGDRCPEACLGGSTCGRPVLIDGSCVGASEHRSWWCLEETDAGTCWLKAGHEGDCEPERDDEDDLA